MNVRQYFSYTVLMLIAAFILLPSSKLVNNLFYVLIAIPALVYFIRFHRQFITSTYIDYLFLVFLSYCFIFGLIHDPGFAKYSVYLLLFTMVISRLVDLQLFTPQRIGRLLFWGLIAYVLISAAVYTVQGGYELGDRLSVLPSRLSSPIFTSTLIACSLVLVTPFWIRQRSYFEASAGITLALLTVSLFLQSRTGLVGIGLWAACISVWLAAKYKFIGIALVTITMGAALSLVGYTLIEADKLSSLYTRADSNRFQIWQFVLSSWSQCGIFQGCGLNFEIQPFSGEKTYNHPHSIFMAIGIYLGLLPLVLFIFLMVAVLWLALKQQNWWGGYLIMALILLNLDGSLVVDSPNELWLLVWLPAGLIVNQHLIDKQKMRTN